MSETPRPAARHEAPRWLLVFALAALLSVAALGTRGLGEPDEGRYVAVAGEMLASGSWLAPTLHGEPHFTKPPVVYWLVAAGLAVTGDEWGARAFLVPAHVATSLLVALLGAAMLGRPAGRFAGLVYATMLFPFAAASLITPDALLAALTTGALACAWWLVSGRAERPRRCAAGFWLLVAAGFAVKGPPALVAVAVLLVLAVLPGGDRQVTARMRALVAPLPLAAAALLGLSWYAAMAVTHPGLVEHWVRVELLGRTFVDVHGRNAQWYQPLKLWLPAFTAGALPWCLLWPVAWRRRGTRATGEPGARSALARRFCWTWLAVPVVLFALAPSRGVLYVLPAFAPLCLLTTIEILERTRRSREPRLIARLTTAAAVVAVALVLVRAGASWVPSDRDGRAVAAVVAPFVEGTGHRVLVVGRPLHSAGHYLRVPVAWDPLGQSARVTFGKGAPPGERLDDAARAREGAVLVVSNDVVPMTLDRLARRGRSPDVHATPFDRSVLVLGGWSAPPAEAATGIRPAPRGAEPDPDRRADGAR